jgi:hypothetical protein
MRIPLPARVAPSARRAGLLSAVIAAAGLLAACGPTTTPEQQVRAVVTAAESAAEKRDLSTLMALVSPRYQDANGGSAVELSRTLRGYFLTHQSVHLLARVESVKFPYKDMARVQLTVGTLGRQASAADDLRLAADVHEVTLELQLERGEWKVTRAEWQPVVGT